MAGEPAAQDTFVRRYAGFVFSVCRRKGLAPDDAEDVTQEVLADAFAALPRFRGEARLSCWLFTLTTRAVADHYRSAARRLVAAGRPGDPGFPGGEPADRHGENRFVEEDLASRARAAVEAMDEPARTILLAYHLGELSVGEIARELHMPEGTVKSTLRRGRLAVRRVLEAT
jgi:RNA polymerase sigma-70 factor (ECF subfamily)